MAAFAALRILCLLALFGNAGAQGSGLGKGMGKSKEPSLFGMGKMGMGMGIGKMGKGDFRWKGDAGLGAYKGFANASTQIDINKDGNCKQDLKSLCADVKRGRAQQAHCLTEKHRAARTRKLPSPVSKKCRKEVEQFLITATRLNSQRNGTVMNGTSLTPGFRKACSKDATRFCSAMLGPQLIPCLKGRITKLSRACKEKVFEIQKASADNMALDVGLSVACLADLKNISQCSGIPMDARSGLKKACLKEHRFELSNKCREQLFVREQEDSADIRLSVDTFKTCRSTISTFCADQEFGEARMLKCLWEHKVKDGFDLECRKKVETLTERAESDYRLDFRIRTRCAKDIGTLCANEKLQVDNMTAVQLFGKKEKNPNQDKEGASGLVLTCLKAKRKRGKIVDDLCRAEVERLVATQAESFKTDAVLARRCQADINRFCSDVTPHTVHLCLRRHIDRLADGCKAAELLQGALESKDIAMKMALKKPCETTIQKFCSDTSHGDARVIKCLQNQRRQTGFSSQCKQAVEADMEASNHDYRLKFGISEFCQPDIDSLCADNKQSGNGASVLSCLKKNRNQIRQKRCKKEVKTFIRQGAANIKNAPVTYAKCMDDVQLLCDDVTPGGGRIHDCLLSYRWELSFQCREAEFKEQEMVSEDATLSPQVTKLCADSIRKLCPEASQGGKGALWQCLEDHVNSDDMGQGCGKTVRDHVQLKNSEFLLNPGLAKDCNSDATLLCDLQLEAAKSQDFSSNGAVISCLIEKRKEIKSTACKQSLLRKEKQRADDVSNDPEQEANCRLDIDDFCPDMRGQGPGAVHSCLQTHLANLTDACKASEMTSMALSSEDIRLNSPMHKNCKPMEKKFCADVPKGQDGKVITCLLKKKSSIDMDPMCRTFLLQEQKKRAKNIIFNPLLMNSCLHDLQELERNGTCTASSAKGKTFSNIIKALPKALQGASITCLTRNRELVKNKDCKSAIFAVMQRQSEDMRAVPQMEKRCKKDVERICADVGKAEGLVHACLRKKVQQIRNSRCKKMVEDVEMAESKDATLNPAIMKNCKTEMKVFCSDVQHGKTRMMACLLTHSKMPSFLRPCKNALQHLKADPELLKAAQMSLNDIHNTNSSTVAREVKMWLESHRSFLDKYGLPILAGAGTTTTLICSCLMYCLISRRCKSNYHPVVIPCAEDEPEA